MAPALVSSQPKLRPRLWVGSTVPQFLHGTVLVTGADIRIFQIHSLFKFGTQTVKKIPILSRHKMVWMLQIHIFVINLYVEAI